MLRNAVKSVEVDTLAEIGDVGLTAFADTSLVPDVAYEYRVAVVSPSPERISPIQDELAKLLFASAA